MKKLLLIDDFKITKWKLDELLKETDYEIIAMISDIHQAIEWIEDQKPICLLVNYKVLDYPGDAIVAYIRDHFPDIKAIELVPDSYEIEDTEEYLMNGFMKRSFQRDDVLNVIKKVIENE